MFNFLLTFFQKQAFPITHTTRGSHGNHWFTLFKHPTDEDTLMNYIAQAIESGQQTRIDNALTVIDNPSVRAIAYNKDLITAFPCLQGINAFSAETHTITEWEHSYNLEATITVRHPIGAALSFFATDYAYNKHVYRKQKNINVALVGLAYKLEDFNSTAANQKHNLKFSDNFCSYFPVNNPDEISIIGRIRAFQEYTLGTISGYILTVPIASHSDSEDIAIILDIFIARDNVTIDIAVDKHVTGIVWLIGSID